MLPVWASLTHRSDREKMHFILIKHLAGNVGLMATRKNQKQKNNEYKEALVSFGWLELSTFSGLKVDFLLLFFLSSSSTDTKQHPI